MDGNIIQVAGNLNSETARELVNSIDEKTICTLDFNDVTSINFAALRILLRARQNGLQFCVINASQDVAERFEDTGVSVYINICRKPKPLKLGQWDEFGAGFLSKAFNSDDGDSMIKVYDSRVPKWVVAQEKTMARAVMVMGIPTPLVGTLYEDGDQTGLDFERIEGKRSFSRVISDEPERLEEMSVRFAKMCKKLHSTPCETTIFPDRTIFYRRSVAACKELTDSEKEKVLSFISSVPAKTTCLHGDMQPSNVITNGTEDLWIDLADFGYGNPLFDMGMWYFLSNLISDGLSHHIFHLPKDVMKKVWDIFTEEYFGARSENQKAEIVQRVEPFAALHMIHLGTNYGFEPGMVDFIKSKIQ